MTDILEEQPTTQTHPSHSTEQTPIKLGQPRRDVSGIQPLLRYYSPEMHHSAFTLPKFAEDVVQGQDHVLKPQNKSYKMFGAGLVIGGCVATLMISLLK